MEIQNPEKNSETKIVQNANTAYYSLSSNTTEHLLRPSNRKTSENPKQSSEMDLQ